MSRKELLERLSKLGLTLFEAEAAEFANTTLAEVVQSKDLRLWEGFPVVLANSAQRGLFDYQKVKGNLDDPLCVAHLHWLIVMSLALYEVLQLTFSWRDTLYASLPKECNSKYSSFVEQLTADKDVRFGEYELSGQRLKATFHNYFTHTQRELDDLVSVKEQLSLEYALSQVFSPKQKELFLKKFKGEKLSKTEKEYFSRVVKKKVLALANSELHRLAQRLLE